MVTGAWQGAQSGKCLDLNASGQAEIETCTGSGSQVWSAEADGTMRDQAGACLAPTADGTANGTRIVAATCDGTKSQSWSTNGDGSITNGATGQCLDVYGQATSNGGALDAYSCNGGANQRWTRITTAS